MDKSKNTYQPHYILIFISTLKAVFVFSIFILFALLFVPNMFAPDRSLISILNLLKYVLALTVFIYIYLMIFWKGISVTFTDTKIDFKMTMGRKNHIEIIYSDIKDCILKQGPLEKILGVSRIVISLKNKEKTYGDDIAVLEQYLVFDTKTAKNLSELIIKSKDIRGFQEAH